jgi:hypothetical protein
MLDSRIIDLAFNKVFLKLVLGEEVPLTIDTLKVSIYLMEVLSIELNPSFSWLILTSQTLLLKSKVSHLTIIHPRIK